MGGNRPLAMQKLCLGCAFGWGLGAVVLVIVALTTDFWYFRSNEFVALNTWRSAFTYGLFDYCYYYSVNKDWSADTNDDNWHCYKWDDLSAPTSAWEDCKKAVTNGVAWNIMGLLATGPAALICLLTCFCADTCMSGFCGKCISFLAIGAMVFATVAFVIAPSVLAGECEELNKGVTYGFPFGTY